ncbi:MAG: TetR/AcrR family transcriptional regulator [Dehalococcoidia bacterium]
MQFDPDAALASAMNAFWLKGYEATSLQDLLRATGLSKSSLYQTFGSKHQLFERCLDFYQRSLGTDMAKRLDTADCGLVFLKDVLLTVIREADGKGPKRGCFLMNTASEFGGRDLAVASEVTRGTERMGKIFQTAIERAQRAGKVTKDLDTKALARYFMTNVSGLRTMVKAKAPREELRKVVEIIMSAFR